MNETISQGGELLISVLTVCLVVGAVMLLLSQTDAGVIRTYVTYFLEAAC